MLELIHIHIPKTAGRSFHAILRQVYKGRVVHKDIFPRQRKQEQESVFDLLRKSPRAITGHMKYYDLRPICGDNRIRIVTWVRDPVERVISYHLHMQRELLEGRMIRTTHRLGETIEQYCIRPNAQNVMSEYLDGIALKDLFFVGVFEHFEEDLQELARLLSWPPFKVPHVNPNPVLREKHPCTPDAVRAEILRLNQVDVCLYNQALRLREDRKKGSTARS